MKKLVLLIIALVFFVPTNSQSKKDKDNALEIAQNAIEFMDNGEIEKSIELLKESIKLDPKNFIYPYEIGYAHYLNEDYKSAIKVLSKVIKFKELNQQCFTLLGNAYDVSGNPKKAIKIYDEGFKKFPNSGRLYYEKGNVLEVLEEYESALSSWENGIIAEPTYPSNYRRASEYYCNYTTEKIWGVLYGELFINMERNTKKTEEMSYQLYDTYLSAIEIKSDTTGGVSFSKNMTLSLPKKNKKMVFPFSMPFEMTMSIAMTTELEKGIIDIQSLHNIRTSFINIWYDTKKNKDFPNILFDWHKKLIDLDYFESYNYWIFMQADDSQFDNWYELNQQKFDEFVNWFSEHPLEITNKNNFHRTQYK